MQLYSIINMYPSHKATASSITQLKGTRIVLLLMGWVIVMVCPACKNSGDIPPVAKTTYLDVVNADVNTLNVYQNGTRINNISGLYQNGNSGYLVVKAGATNFNVKLAGNSNYLINDYPLTLDTNNLYSLFIAGETPDKLFLVNDGAGLPDSLTLSTIRFVNASTSNLSVSVGTINYVNRAFKSASGFSFVASDTTMVSVYRPGSSTALLKRTIVLVPGTIYTLFTTGVPGGTGSTTLSAQLIINGTP